MKDSIIRDFNLPNYIKNKSFAEASKLIDKKFQDREDIASKETKEELLKRLAEAQEYIKMQESLKSNSTQVPDNMNGEVPEGMEEFMPQTQMNMGGYIEGANFLLNSGQEAFGDPNINTSGLGYIEPEKEGAAAGKGALKGAATGASVGSIIPGVGTAIGAGVGAVVGGVSSFLGAKKANKEIEENNRKYSINMNNQYKQSDFAEGGLIDPIRRGLTPLGQALPSAPTELPSAISELTFGDRLNAYSKIAGNTLKDNFKEAIRTAPILANALELKNLEQTPGTRRDRLDNRYIPNFIDEAALSNKVAQSGANARRAITESSGGDLGALRANILGAQINETKGLSDALINSQNINNNERARAQEFNLNVDRTNLQQSNQDLVDRTMDTAAYETNKSNLKRALFEDIGNLGKELQDKETVAKMYGHKFDGEYFIDANGNKLTPVEFSKIKKELDKENGED